MGISRAAGRAAAAAATEAATDMCRTPADVHAVVPAVHVGFDGDPDNPSDSQYRVQLDDRSETATGFVSLVDGSDVRRRQGDV